MKRDEFGLYREHGLYVAGQWRAASDGAVREVIDPSNEEVVGWIPVATAADLDAALEAARVAFAAWRQVSPWERAAMLRRTAALMRERVEAIATLMSTETGKPIAQARGELSDAADQFDWYAGETQRVYGHTLQARPADVRLQVRFEPVGVVAAFTAWNFPALLPARKIAAALAAGCAIVVKPASEAPGSCMAIVQALHDAGAPAGLVNLVTGDSSFISTHLLRSPVVAKVTLTGSTAVGKRMLAQAAEGVKRVSMELGGHAPVLVFEDTDVMHAAEQCARFKFRNCGQVCASPSRFYVHESIYDRFCARFAEVASSLHVGPGLDPQTEVGPMANRRGLLNTRRLIDDAMAHGASLLCGGGRPSQIPGDKGHYLSPTVLADVPTQARVMHEEPFGPVAPIAPFATFDEAIKLANGTPYGLASYLFSNDARTIALASEAIEAGMVGVNDLAIAAAELPFGGVKESGMGREGGALGLRDYLEAKMIRTRLL